MPSVNELINQRITRLRSVPTNLITAIDKVNIQLFDELIRLLGNLETRGGNLVLNSENLARVEEIAQILQAVMFDGDYIKAVVQFAKEYGVQLDLNKQILSALGEFTDDALFGQIMTAAQTQSIALLDESAVTAQFSQVIKDILTQSISTEQRFSDAVDQLRDFIIGNPDLEPAKDGAWTKHAKQIAFDAFAISDRRTHNIMADQSGYEWFRYDGQEIKGVIRENQKTGERREVGGSRCFCRARKGKIFHISELEAWGNRENINEPGNCEITLKDGSLGWQGINEATNSKNIREFLGGWNCVDILVAVPLADVPAAVLARVENAWDKWLSGLTDDERKAISEYGRIGVEINQALRLKNVSNLEEQRWRRHTNIRWDLDSAIEKAGANTLPRQKFYYRRVRFPEAHFDIFEKFMQDRKVGGLWEFNHYVSTTSDINILKKRFDGGRPFKIDFYIKPRFDVDGRKAFIEGLTGKGNEAEQEILYGLNSIFEIEKIEVLENINKPIEGTVNAVSRRRHLLITLKEL